MVGNYSSPMTSSHEMTSNTTWVTQSTWQSSDAPVPGGDLPAGGVYPPGRSTVVVETITLGLMWVLAVLGNILVALVIYRSRRLQSTTNYFVVSLAATDVLLAVLAMPFILAELVAAHWTFGAAMCKLVRFVQHVVPASSMYVLVSICVDRYYTILYPLSFKVTRGRAKQMILVTWVAALLIASPCFYFYRQAALSDGGGAAGEELFSCGVQVARTWDGVFYVIFASVLIYLLPIALLVLGYTKISRYIWRAGVGGRTFQRTSNPVPRAKVKMVKMIMVVTALVVGLMCPLFVLHLWGCSPHSATPATVHTAYIAVVWLYFSTTVVKPAVYMCYNSNFRRGCREVFCMSNMKCYRSNAYTITTASQISKKNHVGIVDADSAVHDYRRVDTPTKTFDRSLMGDKHSWPLGNSMPSTYL